MKSPGFRHTKSIAGHQDCGTCHPSPKNGRARERRESRTEAREAKLTRNPHQGSSFDSWLEEEGILEIVEADAKEVLDSDQT